MHDYSFTRADEQSSGRGGTVGAPPPRGGGRTAYIGGNMAVRKPLPKGDDGSGNRYPVRGSLVHTCGMQHDPTSACPGNLADIPPTWIAPKCSFCGAREWTVDHLEGDDKLPLACEECALKHEDGRADAGYVYPSPWKQPEDMA